MNQVLEMWFKLKIRTEWKYVKSHIDVRHYHFYTGNVLFIDVCSVVN
jgi:hypothetical protein